jgi:hypothetical protein
LSRSPRLGTKREFWTLVRVDKVDTSGSQRHQVDQQFEGYIPKNWLKRDSCPTFLFEAAGPSMAADEKQKMFLQSQVTSPAAKP